MICPECGGDTFIMVSDAGLKCENCGYVYSIKREK
jgi:ribosomal protein S27AE